MTIAQLTKKAAPWPAQPQKHNPQASTLTTDLLLENRTLTLEILSFLALPIANEVLVDEVVVPAKSLQPYLTCIVKVCTVWRKLAPEIILHQVRRTGHLSCHLITFCEKIGMPLMEMQWPRITSFKTNLFHHPELTLKLFQSNKISTLTISNKIDSVDTPLVHPLTRYCKAVKNLTIDCLKGPWPSFEATIFPMIQSCSLTALSLEAAPFHPQAWAPYCSSLTSLALQNTPYSDADQGHDIGDLMGIPRGQLKHFYFGSEKIEISSNMTAFLSGVSHLKIGSFRENPEESGDNTCPRELDAETFTQLIIPCGVNLISLTLNECHCVDDTVLVSIGAVCPQLSYLGIHAVAPDPEEASDHCTDMGYLHLKYCLKLETLDVRYRKNFTEQVYVMLCVALPRLTIRHRAIMGCRMNLQLLYAKPDSEE